MEEQIRFCLAEFQKLLGWSEEQMEEFEDRIRRTVEEKRRAEKRREEKRSEKEECQGP